MALLHGRGYPSSIAADATDAVRLVEKVVTFANEGEYDRVLELCHPEVEASLKSRPGEPVRGLGELERFLREFVAERPLFEVGLSAVDALDERRIIAQGRLRWMDDDRVLRDDPVVWAIELEDGLLRRSTATRTVSEAEGLLTVASSGA